jgi:hypothetical protein
MKRRLMLTGSAVLGLGLAFNCIGDSAQAQMQNLVVNGGFETGSLGAWYNFYSHAYVDSSHVHSGSYAAALTGDTPSYAGVIGQCLNTVPGASYTLTFWLAHDISGLGYGGFGFSWDGNGVGVYATDYHPAIDYTFHTYSLVASGSTTCLEFGFSEFNLGVWHLDDVRVVGATPTPTPTPAVSIQIQRVGSPVAYENLTGAGVTVDTPLAPLPIEATLKAQPTVSQGLVADGVTPLLIQIKSSPAPTQPTSYRISLAGDGVVSNLASHLWVLQTSGSQPAFAKGNTVTLSPSHPIGFAYISALLTEDLNAAESNVVLNVIRTSDSRLVGTISFRIAKPPVVLVHGYRTNACTWSTPEGEPPPSGDFLEFLRPSRPTGFVVPVNYGVHNSPAGPLFCSEPGATFATSDTLRSLALDLDGILMSRVENHDHGLFPGWAFNRYDVVCHSQGGVLVRMLCQNSISGPGARPPFAQTPVISGANGNRGRFRRVITIGSPQNGSTLLRYIFDLKFNRNSLKLLRLIPREMGDLVQSKFDPYDGEIAVEVNKGAVAPIENRLKCFHCIATRIGHASSPLSYKFLGLPSVPKGSHQTRRQILLPLGSDGVVNVDSQTAGNPPSSVIPSDDISHAPPFRLFGVAQDESQTHSHQLAIETEGLLNGSASNFGMFSLPGPTTVPSKADVDSIAASLSVSDIVISQIALGASQSRLPAVPSGTTSYRFGITPNPHDPVSGEINWFVENRTTNGVTTVGVTAIPDPMDPTKVTVTVDDAVTGDVVLYVTYITQKEALVLGKPVLVVSRPPAPSPIGIDIGQSSFVLNVGDVIPVSLYADYAHGVRMAQFVGANESLGLQSANPAVVVPDAAHDSFVARSAGTTTVTVTFHGFTTHASVTVSSPIAPAPTTLGNISTRGFVQTGDNVMIGGFIIEGSGPKTVIIRAIGPELTHYGVPNALADPTLELHNGTGALIASNDNWQTTHIGGIITAGQVSAIQNSGHAPTQASESAMIATLQPGNYTAIVRGANNTTGVALVEVDDLSPGATSFLGNISTREFVQTGDNVMIGGFIIEGSAPKTVIVRGIGPELSHFGVPNPLADPTLELHDGSGALIASNDNWQTTHIGGVITANQVSPIQNSGHAPTQLSESAIIATLPPGNYTAIVRGKNNTTGVALVEVYDLP